MEISVTYLRAEAGVRYWEDATINGAPDEDGTLVPCRQGEAWAPVIRLSDGIIDGWPQGTVADIHYKVCDDGRYELLDAGRNVVASIDGYVPKIMCPGGSGYGDYIIMSVDATGKIADWHCDLSPFETTEIVRFGSAKPERD